MSESIFDYPEITSVILLARIYDAQMALLAVQDPETAGMLKTLHQNGDFMAPPVSIRMETDEPDNQAS